MILLKKEINYYKYINLKLINSKETKFNSLNILIENK